MNKSALISVALCTYNGEKYLTSLLDSLVSQTYKYLEIIIVDDASSDGTWALLQQYAAKDTRIKLYRNEENVGYNANFAKALQYCQGEWIAICDQDDIWNKHKLMMLYNAREEHLLLYHDSEMIDGKGRLLNKRISDKFNCYSGSDASAFLLMNCVSGHSVFFHRSLLEHLFPIPASVVYDQWIAYVAALHGSVKYVDWPLVQYRQHMQNATDILGLRSVKDLKVAQKVTMLKKEANWLQECASRFTYSPPLVKELAALSERRNSNLLSIEFGWTVWKYREELLCILKKHTISKLFFTLRKSWGIPAKRIWG